MVERTIQVGGHPVQVGGVAGMMTLPDQRGRGYATASMQRAVHFLGDERQVPFSLLICLPKLTPFYAGLGWEPVNAPAYYHKSGHKQAFVYYTSMMVYRHNGDSWPPGDIDLCGPPW
jgi:predicted acetyltransferase